MQKTRGVKLWRRIIFGGSCFCIFYFWQEPHLMIRCISSKYTVKEAIFIFQSNVNILTILLKFNNLFLPVWRRGRETGCVQPIKSQNKKRKTAEKKVTQVEQVVAVYGWCPQTFKLMQTKLFLLLNFFRHFLDLFCRSKKTVLKKKTITFYCVAYQNY